MPRAYLKHCKGLGRKSARGGASRRSEKLHDPFLRGAATRKRTNSIYVEDEEDLLYTEFQKSNSTSHASSSASIGQCGICCEEEAPLVNLLARCKKNHPPACFHCLRRLYVTMAQNDVSSYPLRCFHPSCGNVLIREENLFRHGIIESEAELARHRRLTTLAKASRTPGAQTLHCPECDCPRVVRKVSKNNGKIHVSLRQLPHDICCRGNQWN